MITDLISPCSKLSKPEKYTLGRLMYYKLKFERQLEREESSFSYILFTVEYVL